MKHLYRLEHFHMTDGYNQVLYIGIFSSVEEVEKVIDHLITKSGFKDHPRKCFHITKKKIDKVEWESGFLSINGKDKMIK